MTDRTVLSRRTAALALLASVAGCVTPPTDAVSSPTLAETLAPLARFLGTWRGTGSGQPGDSAVERSYTPVLGGRFIEVRNRSVYLPQTRNPSGETHEDVGYLSFDRARKRFVLRQFHTEGFVNQYVSTAAEIAQDVMVFDSEAIENIGTGWRARETYRFLTADTLEEVFELAAPGKSLEIYSKNSFVRTA